MNNEAMWNERVSAWRSSGMTSAKFCEGKDFTAGGLRHWAYRLRQTRSRKRAALAVRIAKVQRAAPVDPAPVAAEPLLVEVGGIRVTVRPGFDRPTFAAIVDVLAGRGVRS